MADAYDITLHALGSETVSGQGSAIDIGGRTAVKLTLEVSVIVERLTVGVETSDDGTTNWRSLGSFTPVTAVTDLEILLCFDRCRRYVRATWVLASIPPSIILPSATFALSGEAHQLYAKRSDLTSELPTSIVQKLSASVLIDALIKASSDAEAAFSAANRLPLTKWPESLVQRTAAIAAFYALKAYAFVGGGIDELIVKAYDDAQRWLKSIAERKMEVAGIEPESDPDTRVSSGDPDDQDNIAKRMSDNWGDF